MTTVKSHARAYRLADAIVQEGYRAEATLEPTGYWTVLAKGHRFTREDLTTLAGVADAHGAQFFLVAGELQFLADLKVAAQP
jgi:hypothetical protein